MATFTASAYTNPVRRVHAGVNARYFAFSTNTFGSAGDVVALCKLPPGARIINVSMHLQTSADTSNVCNVIVTRGSSLSTTLAVLGSITACETAVSRFDFATQGLTASRAHVSFSDVDMVPHASLALVVTAGTNTATMSLNGTVTYYVGDESY